MPGLRTVYLLTCWFAPFSGEHEAIATLAEALRVRGYNVLVFSRAAVSCSNHYARRLAANGIPLIAPPAWLGPLGNDWETWKIREGILRLLVVVAAPFLLLAALFDAAIRRRPLRRSWVGAVGRYRGWLARVVHWDYLTFLLYRKLEAHSRQFPPDVVHVHGYQSGFPQAVEWACLHGLPTVYSHHGTPGNEFAPDQGFHVSVSKATLLIAPSEAARAALQEISGTQKEFAVVPHIVGAPQRLSGSVAKPLVTGEVATITCVARLSPEKGIEYLLSAAQQVLRQYPMVQFLLAGDGPLRAALTRRSQELGITDHVLFHGPFDHDRLPEIMAKTDIFVLPSLTEGLPVTVIEAMAYGKPIVATRVGGIPELITDGESGLLVRPKDPHSLAQALIQLLSNGELCARLGATARQRYEQGRFTPQAVVDATIEVYRKAIELHRVEATR
jgi:glycosyltransferase involved in cell wall biosynthesis